jgi:hypothetical protein
MALRLGAAMVTRAEQTLRLLRAFERSQRQRVEVWRVVVRPLTPDHRGDVIEMHGYRVAVVRRVFRSSFVAAAER